MTFHRSLSRNRLSLSGPVALLAFIVTFSIAVFPIFSHDFVSMNDVYNHVARAAVLAHYNDIATFKQYWVQNWRLVPYLGYDLLQVWLLSWFSMGFVVKLMIAASFVALFGGTMVLSRVAHGRWTAVSLISVVLLLNRTLLAGFVNYLFGVGLSLLGAAVWVALRERSLIVRLTALTVFATVIYGVHLFACGVLGVIVVGIEIAVLAERRVGVRQFLIGLAMPAVAFVPTLLLLAFVAPHPEYHAFVTYRSLASRVGAFAVPLTYAPIEEAVGFVAIGVAIMAFWLTGRVSIDRRLAAAAGLLLLVQLAMPADIGTATVADHRIPIAFWMVVLCAIDIRVAKASLAAGFMLLIAAVFVARVGLLQLRWTKDNVVYKAAYADMASLPATSRVATAYPASGLNSATRPDVALYYMPTLVFVPRGGFTQILFAISDQQCLVMQPAFKHLTAEASPESIWGTFATPAQQDIDPAERAGVLAAIKHYDYVVFLDAEPFDVSPMNMLEPVRNGPGIRIYRVLHQAASGVGAGSGSSGPGGNPVPTAGHL